MRLYVCFWHKADVAKIWRSAHHDFDAARRTINGLLSERAYSSSKRLIVRHKIVQQREQFCSPLNELAFQFAFLDQFDLPVG
jgi:hypothetical protein